MVPMDVIYYGTKLDLGTIDTDPTIPMKTCSPSQDNQRSIHASGEIHDGCNLDRNISFHRLVEHTAEYHLGHFQGFI